MLRRAFASVVFCALALLAYAARAEACSGGGALREAQIDAGGFYKPTGLSPGRYEVTVH